MRAGGFEDGTLTLRAKIDMQSPNINMRDPVLYRIKHAEHWRAGGQMVHISRCMTLLTQSKMQLKALHTPSVLFGI